MSVQSQCNEDIAIETSTVKLYRRSLTNIHYYELAAVKVNAKMNYSALDVVSIT